MSNRGDLDLSLAEALFRTHSERADRAPAGDRQPPPFAVTISREAGALGSTIAGEVGRRLGWPVYDRDVLEKVAERLRHPPHRVEAVDERAASWVEECVFALLDSGRVAPDAYLKHLTAVVRGLGANGRCVIVGRGANFILPAETTLSVRLIALPKDRVAHVAGKFGMADGQAQEWVRTTERERVAFVKRNFGKDPADPLHYDLVLNVSRLFVEEAAAIIVETLRRREAMAARGAKAEKATVA